MEKYRRVEKAKQDPVDIKENEIRITTQGKMRNYISYATNLLTDPNKQAGEIVLKAMGRAINKTVTIAEIIKRRVPGLHQNTQIDSTEITDVWEPLEEGLHRLENVRHVSSIQVTLSTQPLDESQPGYQPPIPADQVKPLSADLGEHAPRGGRRGRGRFRGGRGRGRGGQGPSQPPVQQYENPPPQQVAQVPVPQPPPEQVIVEEAGRGFGRGEEGRGFGRGEEGRGFGRGEEGGRGFGRGGEEGGRGRGRGFGRGGGGEEGGRGYGRGGEEGGRPRGRGGRRGGFRNYGGRGGGRRGGRGGINIGEEGQAPQQNFAQENQPPPEQQLQLQPQAAPFDPVPAPQQGPQGVQGEFARGRGRGGRGGFRGGYRGRGGFRGGRGRGGDGEFPRGRGRGGDGEIHSDA